MSDNDELEIPAAVSEPEDEDIQHDIPASEPADIHSDGVIASEPDGQDEWWTLAAEPLSDSEIAARGHAEESNEKSQVRCLIIRSSSSKALSERSTPTSFGSTTPTHFTHAHTHTHTHYFANGSFC